MTLSVSTRTGSFLADGLATPRNIGFRLIDNSDLVVTANGAAQTLNVHYQLTGTYPAQQMIPITPFWANGVVVRYERQTPARQLYDMVAGVPMQAETMEKELDRNAMAVLDMSGELDVLASRALMVPAGEIAGTLPSSADMIDRLLVGDAQGQLKRSGFTASALALLLSAAFAPGPVQFAQNIQFAHDAAGAVARDIRAELAQFGFRPEQFGAVGDGVANDRPAVQKAFDLANALGKPVRLSANAKYFFAHGGYLDAVRMRSCTVIWEAGAEIIWGTFGLPALYNHSNGDVIKFIGTPKFRWDGTIPIGGQPAISSDFVTNTLYIADGRTGSFNGTRDNVCALGLWGTNFTCEGSMSFVATDFSHVSKLMPCGVGIAHGPNGYNGDISLGDLFFDGTLMGVQAYNYRTYRRGTAYSDRWGQLPLVTYPHSLPGHFEYHAPDAVAAKLVIWGPSFDAGTKVAGTDDQWGSSSYKITTYADQIFLGDMVSNRGAGLANIHCKSGTIGTMRWKGAAWVEYQANRAITLGAFDSGLIQAQKLLVDALYLDAPADDQGSISIGGKSVQVLDGCYESLATSAALTSLWNVYGDNHKVRMKLDLPNIGYNSFMVVATLNAGASSNRFDLETTSPDWANMRLIENGGVGDFGNTFSIRHLPSGSVRSVVDNMETFDVIDEATVTFANDAFKDVTSSLWNGQTAVPAGAVLDGVTSRINTAIPAPTTGYQIGDGATVALYADINALSVGTQSGAANLAANALGQKAAHNIRVTAKTANATAGAVNLRWSYRRRIAGIYNV